MASNWLLDKVAHWPTAKLVPYARNPRTHSEDQVAQIAASIVEFGFTNPILAGSDGVIVAGHGRLAAAQKLGLDTLPVVVLDHLTPTLAEIVAGEETTVDGKHRPILNDNLGKGFYDFEFDALSLMLPHCDGAVYIAMSSSELDTLLLTSASG